MEDNSYGFLGKLLDVEKSLEAFTSDIFHVELDMQLSHL